MPTTGPAAGAAGGASARGSGHPRTEDELRGLLGLEPLGGYLPVALRVRGWVATGTAVAVAALLRLVGLGHPDTLMFDEIYYVKDAYALWTLGYESQWAEGSDELFAAGDFSGMSTEPGFVVHPQFGKWLIGLGMQVLGPESSVGWRIAPAIAGVLTVLLLTRLTLRLTRSPVLAGLAGLLLAIDGTALTESRIGLLDMFVGLFATLTMYCLVRDREWSRARLAKDLDGTSADHLAPKAHLRPWLWATGAALGLTCSIKWSGLYLLAAVGILVVTWDTLALRRVRARAWFLEGTIARGLGAFIRLVPTALVVYVLLWWPWFTHAQAYKHGWAAQQRAATGEVARSWLPDALNDLLEYHLSMYTFHVGLDAEHPYQSLPAGWLLQLRPTSFYWPSEEEMAGHTCGSGHCVQAITSIGNIPIWWAACAALVVVLLMGTVGRDWRAWVALSGYLGLYAPWFLYPDRTIFTFYSVAFAPFVVLSLMLALGVLSGILRPVPGSRPSWTGRGAGPAARHAGAAGGRADPVPQEEGEKHPADCGCEDCGGGAASGAASGCEPAVAQKDDGVTSEVVGVWSGAPPWRIRRSGVVAIAVVVVLAVVFAALWWPIWTGQTVSYGFWRWHMLLRSWI